MEILSVYVIVVETLFPCIVYNYICTWGQPYLLITYAGANGCALPFFSQFTFGPSGFLYFIRC